MAYPDSNCTSHEKKNRLYFCFFVVFFSIHSLFVLILSPYVFLWPAKQIAICKINKMIKTIVSQNGGEITEAVYSEEDEL